MVTRARRLVSPSFYLLGFAEEGEDDLELFWGEEFALGGVGGFGKFGHQWLIGVDFTGEEFSSALFAAVGEVGHSKVLLEHKLRHIIKD